MDTSGVIQLVSIVILIFLSGFFSSAETALSTVNRVRMRTLEEEGSKRAARVNKVLDNYSKMISTILIGNNIVNLTASSLATTLAMRINLAVGIATGVLTIVVLLCGEIEHNVDQLAFLGFDDTVLMTDVHVGFQLAFSHGAGFFVGIDL